jgi:LPXTG-motif cell wall-anchored protein
MSFKSRINQRGAMTSFVIIGVILAIGLASSMYFLKKHGEQVRQDKIIANIEQKQANNSKVSEEEAKTGTNTNTVFGAQTADALPETGIEFNITKLLGLGLMIISISNFLASRRNQIGRL